MWLYKLLASIFKNRTLLETADYIIGHFDYIREAMRKVGNNQLINSQRALMKSNHQLQKVLKEIREVNNTIAVLERDQLTNLYRASAFYYKAKKRMDEEPDEEFDIIVLDISNFKLVNEIFGRQSGDRLLKSFALFMVGIEDTELGVLARVASEDNKRQLEIIRLIIKKGSKMEKNKYERYTEKIKSMDAVFEKLTLLEQATDEKEFDLRIPCLLEEVGEYTQSERVYIFDWASPKKDRYHNTFEWCKEGVSSQKDLLQDISIDLMPHWQAKFNKGQSIMIPDVEVLKDTMPSEYQLLKMQGIHSEIAVPIFSNGKLNGFIGLDNPELNFLEMSTKLVSDVGIHLSYMRENKKIMQKLQERQERLEREKHFLDALCIDYTSVYYCDLIEDTIKPIKEDERTHGAVITALSNTEKQSYKERIRFYYDNYVIKETAVDFLEKLSASYLMEHLSIEDRLCYRYNASTNAAGHRCFEVQIARVHAKHEGFQIVMGYRYTDDIIMSVAEMSHELLYSRSVMQALGEYYMSVIYVDLKHDIIQVAKVEDGYIDKFLNKKNNKILGYDEALKTYIRYYVVSEDQEDVFNNFNREVLSNKFKNSTHFTMRYNCSTNTGELFCVEAHVSKVKSNVLKNSVVIGFRNVEELVQKERKQIKLMSQALEGAKRADEAKNNFLLRMSHDIRTPLNGIIGIIDMSERFPEDVEFLKRNRKKAKDAARYLMSLINDVLDMSKLQDETTVLLHEPFDIIELLDDVVILSKMRGQEMKIKIESDKCVNLKYKKLYGSPLHIRRIFMNLMSNAIKYNKYEGIVKCSSKMIDETKDHVTYEFTIEDTGIGIDTSFKKHIFDPFEKENSEDFSSYHGMGLGMPIAKKLLDLMDGEIRVESEKNVGSKFTVTMTFEIAPDLTNDVIEDGNISGMKILLVEDNELNKEVAQFILEDAGALVDTAEDGMQAMDAFVVSKVGEYDVILMDIMMPHMDGIETTNLIRSLEREDAKKVAIIAMTANAFSDDVYKSKNAGMNEHLSKPLDSEKMLKVISRYRKRE